MLFQGVSLLVKNSWGVSEQTVSMELQQEAKGHTLQPWGSSPGRVLLLIGARNKVTENFWVIFFKKSPPPTQNNGILFTSVCRALSYKAQCGLKDYGTPHNPSAKVYVKTNNE